MRRFALLSLALSMGALPLAAQFEGTIVMKTDNDNGKSQTMTWYVRPGQVAMSLPMSEVNDKSTGEFRMVIDAGAHTSTILMPMTPDMAKGMGAMMPNAKGLKMVTKTDSMSISKEGNDVTITRLGTSETVAGVACDDYSIVGKDKDVTKACISDKMGDFMFPTTTMGRRSAPPAWSRAFGNRPAFPLKVTDDKGRVELEAVSITRGPVPASEFVIPDDYVDMSAMMRGMRGGH
jgi:hypothetical protein